MGDKFNYLTTKTTQSISKNLVVDNCLEISKPLIAYLLEHRRILLIAACMAGFAVAGPKALAGERERFLTDAESNLIDKTEVRTESPKVVDFVLGEVRKQLDPNPETDVIELKLDPDYRGVKDTYLVNAVLDAHGRRLTVGVIVEVKFTPDGMKAILGYVD